MNASRRDSLLLAGITAMISLGALIIYYRQGAILLYGDAAAHINIARRVFDSRTPGVFQLGTVWLPLPHVLQIPFIVNNRMWQTGLGASIPSMVAYIAGALGVFRLVKGLTPGGLASRSAAWIAALVFALNPNLIYMQATAMGESLYLALFVWAAVYFSEFVRDTEQDPVHARKSLSRSGIMVAAAMLVRYDGWFLALVIACAAMFVLWRRKTFTGHLRRGLINFVLLTALSGGFFLVYNQVNYGNALEFANGPYSARAIQERSRTATMPTYPGENSPRDAALQFMKISRLNVAEGRGEYYLFTLAILALLGSVYFARKFLPWAILWAPVPFYVACVAWGSVPIYHPDWWPFTYYNVRYGLQLLPAIAVFVALFFEFAARFFPARIVVVLAALMIAGSYLTVWDKKPVCLREAHANGGARMAFEMALAGELNKLPASATLMMDCGAHSGAIQLAGIPFRRVLRESNPPYWENALQRPAQSADYVITFPGDALDRAVHLHPDGLRLVATIGTPTAPKALIYASTH